MGGGEVFVKDAGSLTESWEDLSIPRVDEHAKKCSDDDSTDLNLEPKEDNPVTSEEATSAKEQTVSSQERPILNGDSGCVSKSIVTTALVIFFILLLGPGSMVSLSRQQPSPAFGVDITKPKTMGFSLYIGKSEPAETGIAEKESITELMETTFFDDAAHLAEEAAKPSRVGSAKTSHTVTETPEITMPPDVPELAELAVPTSTGALRGYQFPYFTQMAWPSDSALALSGVLGIAGFAVGIPYVPGITDNVAVGIAGIIAPLLRGVVNENVEEKGPGSSSQVGNL